MVFLAYKTRTTFCGMEITRDSRNFFFFLWITSQLT